MLRPCVLIGAPLLLLCSCSSNDKPSARPIGRVIEIKTPLGLPRVSFPEDNPPTAETIALGRDLFHDPLLSKNRTVACVTCHDPAAGFSDGRSFSFGTGGPSGVCNL